MTRTPNTPKPVKDPTHDFLTPQKGTQPTWPGQTLAALQAAHLTIYEAPIEFEWEAHPHLTEAEAEQVPHIINTLLAEHKTRAELFHLTHKENQEHKQ